VVCLFVFSSIAATTVGQSNANQSYMPALAPLGAIEGGQMWIWIIMMSTGLFRSTAMATVLISIFTLINNSVELEVLGAANGLAESAGEIP